MSDTSSFQERLDQQYSFPALYPFKFIVPQESLDDLLVIFAKHDHQIRPSKNGNYISVSINIMADSSDTIIEYYNRASVVKGIISL
ncbi:DUF493 family protein [Reichenbachiella sp. MALMAid0571]|uniref:DUF493 family protein n=1 Tax=Reichenbachiella sp. MALMAid0571 TaxID=3143939 RepID=UPI0032E0528F